MTSLVEGRLVLEPGEGWRVVKWDDTRDYRDGIGRLPGTKAVDFVAIDAHGRLLLLELKDFRPVPGGGQPVALPFEGRHKELPDEIAQKARDTLAGLWGSLSNGGLAVNTLRPVTFGDVRVVFVLAESLRPTEHRGKQAIRRDNLAKEMARRLRWLTKHVVVVDLDELFCGGRVVAA